MNLELLKMIFGFLLLVVLATLAAIIGLAHVEQTTSYGLEGIVGGLLVLCGQFSRWAFGSTHTGCEEKKDE